MARVLIIEQSAADLVLVGPELPEARRLLAAFRARFPRVPVVAVTGGPGELASLAELDPVFLLAKPFALDDLRQAITHALDGTGGLA